MQSPKQDVACKTCAIKQKFTTCKKQCFILVIIDDSNRNITANFCNDMVARVIDLTDPENKDTDDEEEITT